MSESATNARINLVSIVFYETNLGERVNCDDWEDFIRVFHILYLTKVLRRKMLFIKLTNGIKNESIISSEISIFIFMCIIIKTVRIENYPYNEKSSGFPFGGIVSPPRSVHSSS